jgi:mono/diheme cytochrome c family protein
MWRLGLVLLIAGSASAAPVVLSVDRLYRSDQTDLVEAGEILLTELHCVNCHQPGDALAKRIPVTPAPDLAHAVANLRQDYLRQWLANPHSSKSGTRMPDLLATLPENKRAANAEALAQFLTNLAPGIDGATASHTPNKALGRELYHSVGCVACHEPRADFAKTIAGEQVQAADVRTVSVRLGKLGNRFTRAGLLAFLKNPHESRPDGRMPQVPLNEKELVDLVGYLLGDPVPGNSPTIVRNDPITTGQSLFGTLGCASCHDVKVQGKLISGRIPAKPLAALAGKLGGCLSKRPEKRKIPWYDLDDFQRRALTSALMNLGSTSPIKPIDYNHRRMISLNCYACHQRDDLGGPDDQRLKYFVSSGSDLGDEGRVPPILTGVGRKLQHSAMEQVIQGKLPARPYMVTRMPNFGEAHATFLAAGFAKADFDPNEEPTARDGEEFQVGRNMWGRALLGIKGLSCITCHKLNGKKSLGIQSMDLAHAAKRLRPAWFRDYVIDPAKFRPGTRMPSFWPKGKPMLKGNGNSTARQIDSIWVYLNELDQSRLPEGLETKGDFLVKPTDKPIVFRTFMEGVGMHAIAVGYPAATHAAFDSQNPRWALAWTGKFLDAEGTWHDRFTPLAKPEGENVIAIQPNQPVHEQNNIAKFEGYQLDLRTGHPVFHYRVGGDKFTDTLLPVGISGKGLTRTLTKTSGDQSETKWIEVANGKSIVKAGADWMANNKLRIKTPAPARVLTTADGNHLQIQVGSSSATVTYAW